MDVSDRWANRLIPRTSFHLGYEVIFKVQLTFEINKGREMSWFGGAHGLLGSRSGDD